MTVHSKFNNIDDDIRNEKVRKINKYVNNIRKSRNLEKDIYNSIINKSKEENIYRSLGNLIFKKLYVNDIEKLCLSLSLKVVYNIEDINMTDTGQNILDNGEPEPVSIADEPGSAGIVDEPGQNSIILLQSHVRGRNITKKMIPLFLQLIRQYLIGANIILSQETDDGRNDSVNDEKIVIDKLIDEFGEERIRTPPPRFWYDILIKDLHFGWIPVNIKSSKCQSADNCGNLAICVYSYTNEQMDLGKQYNNGIMSTALLNKIKTNGYNYNIKRDYYFLVINKQDTSDIIINSCKGLSSLTSNNHNLPFQINWGNNREYIYKPIKKCIQQLVTCIKKPSIGYTENFLTNIRQIII
jgi:hypothetical protein